MKKLIDKQIINLMAGAVALFFIFAAIKYTVFAGTGILHFFINIAGVAVLLTIIGLLGKLLLNIHRQETETVKQTLELQIEVLSQRNRDLEHKMALIQEAEDKELEHQSQEAELQKIVTEFLESSNNKFDILYCIAVIYNAMAAILYTKTGPDGTFVEKANFGLPDEFEPQPFSMGEGLNGQTAQNGKPMIIQEIPEEYFDVISGLGRTKPKFIYLLPIMKNEECVALIELASLHKNDLEIVWEKTIAHKF